MTSTAGSDRRTGLVVTLQRALADAGLSPELVQIQPDDPMSVAVPVMPDRKGRPQIVSFTPLPLDEELSEVNLIQLHSVLPFQVQLENGARAAEAVVAVNRRSVLGHFGLQAEEVYFRYVWSAPIGGPSPGAILELLRLFVALTQALGDGLEAVIDGSVSPETVADRLV